MTSTSIATLWLTFWILVLSAGLAVWIDSEKSPPSSIVTTGLPPTSSLAPNQKLTFQTLDKGKVALSSLHGKVVLLHFWASWCAPCVDEFPVLVDLAHKYDGRLVVIAVSSDAARADLDRFLARMKADGADILNPDIRHSILIVPDFDRAITRDAFGVTTYPETLIIGPDGTVRRHVKGTLDPNDLEILEDLSDIVRR